jgi:EAL domain-containing protein (putative c-di-GMP-specific phosphodiesterase class I)
MEPIAQRRVEVALGLRRALEDNSLTLVYQPVIRLSDGATIGVEALVRTPPHLIRASFGGLGEVVSATELVDVAEGSGLAHDLAFWGLREALSAAAYWHGHGFEIPVAVNMSARQLAGPGLMSTVRQQLVAANLTAKALIIELTEGQALAPGDPVVDVLKELRTLGIETYLDDFGTGYATMATLRWLPIRGVKLDRSVVVGIGRDPRAATMARALIGCSRAFGLLALVEGVETMDGVRTARELGADRAQGFALSGPLGRDALIDFLHRGPIMLPPGGPAAPRRLPVPEPAHPLSGNRRRRR